MDLKVAPMWVIATRKLREIIESSDLEEAKLASVQRTILFAINDTPGPRRDESIRCWLDYLERLDSAWEKRLSEVGLEESRFYPEEFVFEVRGRRYSLDFFKKLAIAFLAEREGALNGSSRVLELGAGFGQVERILMALHPGLRCTVIDLPESLYFSSLFLRLNGLDCSFVQARDFETVQGRFDCLVNTSSLGEMRDETARAYLKHFQQRCDLKSIVLLNRLMNVYSPWREANRERECGWYFALDRHWSVTGWELEPEFTRFPGVELLFARELLWTARRSQETVPWQGASLESIGHYSWFSKRKRYLLSRTHDMLWPDPATLRALWENVRLQPTALGLDLLITYLHAIQRRLPFEEETTLFHLYRHLTGYHHPLQPHPTPRFLRTISTQLASSFYLYLNPLASAKIPTSPLNLPR